MGRYEEKHLVRDRPVRRELTCVNVAWSEKERFDRFQDLFSGMLGRRLTQWEAFAILIAVSEERFAEEMDSLRRRER